MKTNFTKKNYIWVLIVIGYFAAEFFIKDYFVKKDLNETSIHKVIQKYEPKKFNDIVDITKQYKNSNITQESYRSYYLALIKPLLLNAKENAFMTGNDQFIYEHSMLMKNIFSTLNPEKCYDFIYNQNMSKSQLLNDTLKKEYELIVSKMLEFHYQNKKHDVISKTEYTNQFKEYVKKAINLSNIEVNIFNKEKHAYNEKKKLCEFNNKLFELLLKDKNIPVLRYNLKEIMIP